MFSASGGEKWEKKSEEAFNLYLAIAISIRLIKYVISLAESFYS
jgi:hypothetical protein